MAQDFFEHYWDTVRWKEVAREARPVSAPTSAHDLNTGPAPAYSGRPLTFAEMVLFLVKVATTFVLMAMCAIGTFVTVQFFFGMLWAICGAILSLFVSWLACTSWCRE
jgi:hypothetical protein